MPIEANGPAPYAPPSAVLEFLSAVRDKELPTPYTVEVLTRAGITEGLAPRVLKTLKLFDLLDDDNQPTDQMHDLAKAGESDYKQRLADVLRAAYADVLQYIDPASDPLDKIQDQFRHYSPRGQRERMVTLFLGLCEFAGIAPPREREVKRSASTPARKPRADGTGAKIRRKRPPDQPTLPPRDDARERYLDFLLKKAEASDSAEPDLLDRIERVLGVARPPSQPSSKPKGGESD
jgi:hypothetical protein